MCQRVSSRSCSRPHTDVKSAVGFVQVTLKKKCYKKNAHVAFSYKGYEKNEDTSVDHKWVVHAYGHRPPA